MKKLIAVIENKRNIDDVKRISNRLFIRSEIDVFNVDNKSLEGLLNLLHTEVKNCLSFKGIFMIDYEITHKRMVIRCKSPIYTSDKAIVINQNGVRFCPKLNENNITPFVVGFCTWIEWMNIRSSMVFN